MRSPRSLFFSSLNNLNSLSFSSWRGVSALWSFLCLSFGPAPAGPHLSLVKLCSMCSCTSDLCMALNQVPLKQLPLPYNCGLWFLSDSGILNAILACDSFLICLLLERRLALALQNRTKAFLRHCLHMATNRNLRWLARAFGKSWRYTRYFSVWRGILAELGAGASCREALSWLCSA